MEKMINNKIIHLVKSLIMQKILLAWVYIDPVWVSYYKVFDSDVKLCIVVSFSLGTNTGVVKAFQ